MTFSKSVFSSKILPNICSKSCVHLYNKLCSENNRSYTFERFLLKGGVNDFRCHNHFEFSSGITRWNFSILRTHRQHNITNKRFIHSFWVHGVHVHLVNIVEIHPFFHIQYTRDISYVLVSDDRNGENWKISTQSIHLVDEVLQFFFRACIPASNTISVVVSIQ